MNYCIRPLRLAEVLGLTVKDVHGSQKEIKVLGKGSKERIVPVGFKAREALSNWQKRPEGSRYTDQVTKKDLECRHELSAAS